MSQVLEESAVRFMFDTGKVAEVCSSSDDPVWATNIRKGVLSVFQQAIEPDMGQTNVTETDVVGRCEAQYSLTGTGWGRTNYRKVAHRQNTYIV